MRQNTEKMMYEIKDTLQDLVADYLDVNRQHIEILSIDTHVCGEDYYDWDKDPYDAFQGAQSEAYYMVTYRYRNNLKSGVYDEPNDMVWQHIESPNYTDGFVDRIMSVERFDELFENKKDDPCSTMWYEGDEEFRKEHAQSAGGFIWKYDDELPF